MKREFESGDKAMPRTVYATRSPPGLGQTSCVSPSRAARGKAKTPETKGYNPGMSNNFYHVAEAREPDTCRVCGHVVKEVGSKARVSGCPVYKEREKAERFLEGMLSVM